MKAVETATDFSPTAATVLENPASRTASGQDAGRGDTPQNAPVRVTMRAIFLGLLLSMGLAGFNAWIETVFDVHFLGGVHLPAGAVFVLGALVLGFNGALNTARRWHLPLVPRPMSSAELLTVYALLLFAAIISTPGTETFFLTVGAGLFYFTNRENRWADTFYSFVPPQFAPGWDGTRYQTEVIDALYLGGLSPSQIPWHAWMPMLISWSVFLLGCYLTLFFTSLLFRRQWIENEALTFPLVELPLRMVDVDEGSAHPPAREFWGNRMLWLGAGLAFVVHFLRGMNNYFPDWPTIAAFQGTKFSLELTDQPWNALGALEGEYLLGAIGVAFLLTRELSGSMWMFFWMVQLELVLATLLGFPVASLPKDNHLGRPVFITYQATGGWIMLAGLLVWTARGHLQNMFREALRPSPTSRATAGEPFSPRVVVLGLVTSFALLLAWSWFANMNLLVAGIFLTVYVTASIVLARLVVEGGFVFPQLPFSPLDWLSGSVLGSAAIGAGDLTRLGFLQTILFADARTNTLPAWLHTLKIAQSQNFSPRDTRRLMLAALAAVVLSLVVTIAMTLISLYDVGGLAAYSWFTKGGTQSVWKGTASMIRAKAAIDPMKWVWFTIGAGLVWGMMAMRSRMLWFSLHPLGFIVASGMPIRRLWLSFFIGWLVKTLTSRYGGNDTVLMLRPFMIGLILGNVLAMVLWMIAGFYFGTQMKYWPA